MARIVKRVKFLKGGTRLAKGNLFPGLTGPRYTSSGSNNRRVRVRG